jgi:SH3 domain
MTFTDGGPPYSEDEDLQSPVVTASKHKKHKSGTGSERGRSPGAAGPNRGTLLGMNGDGSRQYYYADPMNDIDENGPGGEIVEYPDDDLQYPHQPYHRDSNFARPIQRNIQHQNEAQHILDDDYSEAEEDHEDSRFSKDYSFTIASPDEEMHGKAVALFDFAREHENELPLREGQIILVSYRHGQGWLVAEDPKTGESGLVPEEFVRLVRDIEGGLNGLGAVDIHEGEEDETQEDPESAVTPTPGSLEPKHMANASTGSGTSEKHPPVQSNFSTSSKDLEPYPLPSGTQETVSPVRSERAAAEVR